MRNLTQPVKLYYITQIFRYERPQAGRFRQHWQFGFEAIGDDSPALDAEAVKGAVSAEDPHDMPSLAHRVIHPVR